MADRFDIGGDADSFVFRVNGQQWLLNESYEITASFFKQPSAFCMRLGPKLVKGSDYREKLISEILDAARPGTKCELLANAPGHSDDPAYIGIQSGIIDSRGSPAADNVSVDIRGRDYLAPVFDAFVPADRSFSEKTYYDLTRTILDLVGLKEDTANGRFSLLAEDENRKEVNPARRSLTRQQLENFKSAGTTPSLLASLNQKSFASSDASEEVVRALETNATSGTGGMLYLAPKIKLGTRYYDFLMRQYKLAGLFLYASGEGNFYLTRPHKDQEPLYKLFRVRTSKGLEISNILGHSFTDDTTQRHSKAITYGRSGGGKAGRNKLRGEATDQDMVAMGFDKSITIHDEDIKTNTEADYIARKTLADERRESWRLIYTVSGHSTPNIKIGNGARAFWTPDTTVIVEDQELGINETLWISDVTFVRGEHGTLTRIELCHPSDIIYAPPPEKPKEFPVNLDKLRSKPKDDPVIEPPPAPVVAQAAPEAPDLGPSDVPGFDSGGNFSGSGF